MGEFRGVLGTLAVKSISLSWGWVTATLLSSPVTAGYIPRGGTSALELMKPLLLPGPWGSRQPGWRNGTRGKFSATGSSRHPNCKMSLNGSERGPFCFLPSPALEPSSGHFLWFCTNVPTGSEPFFTWARISARCFNVKTRALTVRRYGPLMRREQRWNASCSIFSTSRWSI